MDSRTKLMAYVESVGGIPKAAEALRTPLPTMYGVCAGWRGVGRKLAARWEIESAGVLKAGEMIWVRPTKAERRA
jgi:hypothetical protein